MSPLFLLPVKLTFWMRRVTLIKELSSDSTDKEAFSAIRGIAAVGFSLVLIVDI